MALFQSLPEELLQLFSQPSLGSIAILAGITGSLYLACRAVYALTVDPLASFPGPRLCAVSRFPYWLQVFRGRDIHWIHALHERYGPAVRFGPSDLSFSTPQAWRDFHGHVKGRPSPLKADDYGMQPANGVRSILLCDNENHARVRRIFAPGFSDRALRQQQPIFMKYVNLLVDRVEQAVRRVQSPAKLEMTRYMHFATFDIMAELCFGHPLDLLEKDAFSPWVASIFELISLLPASMFIEYYPVLSSLLKRFEPKWVRDTKDEHFKHSADRVDRRLQEQTNRPDFWSFVVSKDEAGERLSLGEMHSNAELFMLAGTETSATLLSGLLFQLCSEPRKLHVLVAEIRGSHSSIDDMTFESLARLPYLNACIKEGLRIYPPVPSGAPRIVPDGGLSIVDQWVPAKTRVVLTQYAAHRSPANFAEPETFAPERWLPRGSHTESDDSGRFAGDNPEAWLPFGTGARACLGKNMAMYESRLILAALLFRFDFALAEESRGWMEQKAYALWVKNPLVCHVSLAAGTR
ncbi:cytochrome P450 [Microdochium bolleyi]|uniref:Cytochrome P450 n=1 Tax=Microdochium bolleyi TaxID=196109 RepID=A0A136IVP1_9PEZI|nr:cytochrome P450 [Microdochium bolleyi]